MGIYTRRDKDGTLLSPYYWKKYDIDPKTGAPPRPPASTKIHVDGGSKAQSAQNKADALLQFQADCIDIRSGKIAPVVKQKPRILFRDYAPIWFRKFGVEDSISEKTQSQLTQLVDGIVPGADGTMETGRPLGDYFIHEITADVANGWRLGRTKLATHTVKPTTADRNVGILRRVLATADAYIDVHPLKGVNAMGDKKLAPLGKEDTETRWFTRDEFERFIDALESQDAIAGIPQCEGLALTYTAVETLLRRSSLMRLPWSLYRGTHIVPLNAKVAIRRSPVTTNMRAYLDALPRDTPRGLVFPSMFRTAQPTDSPYVRNRKAHDVLRVWFRRVCKLAGLPHGRGVHGLTFHCFRHTGATWLLQAGKSPRAVMDLGGWKNANVFLNTYCHTSDEEVDAAAESLFLNDAASRRRRRHLHLVPAAETPE